MEDKERQILVFLNSQGKLTLSCLIDTEFDPQTSDVTYLVL